MNIFDEIEKEIADKSDSDTIEVSVFNIRRLLQARKAMNDKADIIREFYTKQPAEGGNPV